MRARLILPAVLSLASAGCRDFAADLARCVDAGRCAAPDSMLTGDASVDAGPTPDAGTTEQDCANQRDDDGDGLSDCADPDCVQAVCRPADGGCDAAERCGAASTTCPDDRLAAEGAECAPAPGPCADVSRCQAGRCVGGVTTCDGGAFCTTMGCLPKLGLGTACADDRECATNFCARGRCCDARCDGACERCADSGRCTLLPPGTLCRGDAGPCDEAERCTGDAGACPADVKVPGGALCRGPAHACDLGASCDGGNDCPASTPKPTGSVCVAASCSNGLAQAASTCHDDGGCFADTRSVRCDPYVCGPNQCLTRCASQGDCAGSTFCDGGACLPKKTTGQACQGDVECALGSCVDGVCCESLCERACQACNLAGSLGRCVSVADGAPDVACAPAVCAGGACATTCTPTTCPQPSCAAGAHCSVTGICATGLLPDLAGCVADCQCRPGSRCGGFFADADGDGFTGSTSARLCWPAGASVDPPGWRSSPSASADCCDSDARAQPGQQGYFDTERNDCGGFDFDCDQNQTLQYSNRWVCNCFQEFCSGGPTCQRCVGVVGWDTVGPIPACGSPATLVFVQVVPSGPSCFGSCAGRPADTCNVSSTNTRAACR